MAATQVDKCHLYDESKSVAHENEEKLIETDPVDPIRIAVLGATGVGKSTLCNVICDEKAEFDTSGGFDSCTDQVKSKRFTYDTDTGDQKLKELVYEVIDCPGFFDTDVVLTKMKESELFNDNIKKCIHLTKNGISAYLLLIPYGRMTAYHAASIRFIMEYFPHETKKYVSLIITKSGNLTKNDILNEMQNPRFKQKKASKLLQQFVIDIDGRLIASECVGDININVHRENILKSVYQTHANNNGSYKGNGIWNALKNQLQTFQQQQNEMKQQQHKLRKLAEQNEQIIHHQRKKEIWVWGTTAIGVIIAAIVIGYVIRRYEYDKKIWEEKDAKSTQKIQTLSNKNTNLRAANQTITRSIKTLEERNKNLTAEHTTVIKEKNVLEGCNRKLTKKNQTLKATNEKLATKNKTVRRSIKAINDKDLTAKEYKVAIKKLKKEIDDENNCVVL